MFMRRDWISPPYFVPLCEYFNRFAEKQTNKLSRAGFVIQFWSIEFDYTARVNDDIS